MLSPSQPSCDLALYLVPIDKFDSPRSVCSILAEISLAQAPSTSASGSPSRLARSSAATRALIWRQLQHCSDLLQLTAGGADISTTLLVPRSSAFFRSHVLYRIVSRCSPRSHFPSKQGRRTPIACRPKSPAAPG